MIGQLVLAAPDLAGARAAQAELEALRQRRQ
jgi:hypothetical protein